MSSTINVKSIKLLARIGYWRRLWSSDDFRGETLANCIEVIHEDIVGTWNLPDTDKVCLLFSSWLFCAYRDQYLSSIAFKAEISYLVQDLSGSPISTSSR